MVPFLRCFRQCVHRLKLEAQNRTRMSRFRTDTEVAMLRRINPAQDVRQSFIRRSLPFGKLQATNRAGRSICSYYTLNIFTSLERFSMLSLFFWLIAFTSCTALLICTAPEAISFMLSVMTRVSSSSFCIS